MDYLSPDSYWLATDSDAAAYPALDADMRVETAIIGGGITGLTAALHLVEAGKRVVVLEAGRIGAGASGGTSGHLDVGPDQGFDALLNDFGERSARAITGARRDAIDQIESWAARFAIDCDFRRLPGYLYTETADGMNQIRRQYDAARRMGADVSPVEDVPLPWPCSGALRLERQGRFHSIKYLRGLAAQVRAAGGAIHEHTRVRNPPKDGAPCALETGAARVRADAVIAATHSGFFGVSQLDMREAPYQSYLLAAEVEDEIEDALYWDDASPYHYTRWASSDSPRELLIGGADHKTGHGDERQSYASLESYVRRKFSVRAIRRRWSAELWEPADGVPYIGRMPRSEHLYAATGYSGTGLTWGTAAGRLLADLILGRANPLEEIVTPARLKLWAAAPRLFKENLDVLRQEIDGRFGGEPIRSFDALAPGQGMLVQYRGQLIAAYRDELGALHTHSPVCTHAGCIVQWNQAEQTWDCPCHGGRYDALGRRLYGPPAGNLGHKPPKG